MSHIQNTYKGQPLPLIFHQPISTAMKFATDIITIFTVLAIGLGHHVVSAHPEASGTLNLKPRRQTSILISMSSVFGILNFN